MIKLKNLIKNSNFNNLEYNTSYDTITVSNWTNISSKIINNDQRAVIASKNAYSGSYCIRLADSITFSNKVQSDGIKFIKNHKYYLVCYTFCTKYNDNVSTKIQIGHDRHDSNIYETENLNYNVNEWIKNSFIFTPDFNYNCNVRFINDGTPTYGDEPQPLTDYYIGAVTLIDLTESFGEGAEPSKSWLDEYIPYFVDEYEFQECKRIDILNISDFTKDSKTGLFYNNSTDVDIHFSIENFDELYNFNNDHKLRIKVIQTLYKDALIDSRLDKELSPNDYDISEIILGDYNLEELYVHENKTYFKLCLHLNNEMIGTQIQIIDDASRSNEFSNYIMFNWIRPRGLYKNINPKLLKLFDYRLIEDKTNKYKMTLYGKTLPYIVCPTTIEVYVNGTKQYGIKVDNKLVNGEAAGFVDLEHLDYENLCVDFEKELFLLDGENKIEVKILNIFNEVIFDKIYTSKENGLLNVDIISAITYEQYSNLLGNFIGNDSDSLELTMDKTKMVYVDGKDVKAKDAGRLKPISIDMSNIAKYFELKGDNAKYYRIDRNNLPSIEGDIIQRPLVVSFNGVTKIYDGTPDITSKFYNDKREVIGYRFLNTHDSYNSYVNYGFVKGISEKTNLNINLLTIGETLSEKNSKMFLSSNRLYPHQIILNIDGHIGYSFPDKSNPNAIDFIFDDIVNKSCKKVTKFKDILKMASDPQKAGLFYSITYSNPEDEKSGFTGMAIDISENEMNQFVVKQYSVSGTVKSEVENKLINWLVAIDHKIYDVKIEIIQANVDEGQEFTNYLVFSIIDNENDYIVKNAINIQYTYEIIVDGKHETEYVLVESDEGKVNVSFKDAIFDSKNVTSSLVPISLSKLELTGEAANNYMIANYSAYGSITKRNIIAHIILENKVYDGTPYIPFAINDLYYNGLEQAIEGDDVFISNTYLENPLKLTHNFVDVGSSHLIANFSDVRTIFANEFYSDTINKRKVHLVLEGKDAFNYNLNGIEITGKSTIIKRPIEVVINKIRFIRATKLWEIDYYFINDIKTDNLTIKINSNNGLKVYGGTQINADGDENPITLEENMSSSVETTEEDIITRFFNYDKNLNYEFSTEDKLNKIDITDNEPKVVKTLEYNTKDAMPPEPDVFRQDFSIEQNKNYPGQIKLTSIENKYGDRYFESKDGQYRLYDKSEVYIIDLSLNESDKSGNYDLKTKQVKTLLEII